MNSHEIELNGKTIAFRLRSKDCIEIEKKTNKPILEVVQDSSITNITRLLKYMRRFEQQNISDDEIMNLYDEMIDSGYTIDKIVFDVIYEALVISGFLEKKQLEKIKEEVAEKRAKQVEE